MFNDDIKIAVLGGDRRQIYTVIKLGEKGYDVSVCGLDKGYLPPAKYPKILHAENAEEALKNAAVILLPFPASSDGVHINTPLDKDGELCDFKFQTLVRLAEPCSIIIGGKLPEAFVTLARDKGHSVFDLLRTEALEIKNAYITAEAALSVAMNSLSRTVCGANIAITGFGRISKQLARLLHSLGAHVTVAARKEADLAFCETLGYSGIRISAPNWSDALAGGYDIIFNTVPDRIFDRAFLKALCKDTLLVELASAPGGFDISAAQELGVNISWALSLPGKYAPVSAGELIAENVNKIICEEAHNI